MTPAFIALGSNLSDPAAQLQRGVDALSQLPGSILLRASAIYRSTPVGPADQPDYLNAVVCLNTTLEPLTLLDNLQRIETLQGRIRDVHWGPRTLDLDLLLYGQVTLTTPRLTLPHPRMVERDFVLRPLLDIASADWVLPNGVDLGTLLKSCPDNHLTKTDYPLSIHRASVDEQQ